jgi:hypothetical protein
MARKQLNLKDGLSPLGGHVGADPARIFALAEPSG